MWADAYISSLGQCDKITNEEVLNMTNTTSLLHVTNNKEKKMSVFWTRSQSEVDPKKLLEGKIEGKRGRGRPRVTWMQKYQRMVRTNL